MILDPPIFFNVLQKFFASRIKNIFDPREFLVILFLNVLKKFPRN